MTTPSDEPNLATSAPTVATSPSPPPSPSATPPPIPSPSASITPPALVAAFPEKAEGTVLGLGVEPPPEPDGDCVSHVFGQDDAAYQTDCRSWQEFDLAWFYGSVANIGDDVATIGLGDLFATGANGTSTRPVDVSSRSSEPKQFVTRHYRLGPGETLSGWVTFEVGTGFVARSLSLDTEMDFLTVEFRGPHRAVPRG